MLLGILFERQNVAFMVSLAFAMAASGNVPVLVLSLYWRGCTGWGATIGGFAGIATALVLTIGSAAVWTQTLHLGEAWFPYSSPAIFSVPLGFLTVWLFSTLDRSAQANREREGFRAQALRSETGIGASKASDH
jgi:cation/acetate symporter